MKILWVSRHRPLPCQIAELKRLFGTEVEIAQDSRPFDSAETIAARFREGRYGEMVVVAPLSVIAKLCELGIRPLWAEMRIAGPGEPADLEYNGRRYRFVRFRRIVALRLEFEELEPRAAD